MANWSGEVISSGQWTPTAYVLRTRVQLRPKVLVKAYERIEWREQIAMVAGTSNPDAMSPDAMPCSSVRACHKTTDARREAVEVKSQPDTRPIS
jgi:hypothetical protein